MATGFFKRMMVRDRADPHAEKHGQVEMIPLPAGTVKTGQ